MSKTFTITVEHGVKQIAIPGYTVEATIRDLKREPTYHYGHSYEEVMAKIVAWMLENKP